MIEFINKVIKLLEKFDEKIDYKIYGQKKDSFELYYVLDNLEMIREINVDDIYVTIYKDFEDKKGSSEFVISSSFTDEEIKDKIQKAISRCSYVLNKYYPLPNDLRIDTNDYDTNINSEPLKNIAFKVADAIFKANVYEEGWINSCEIFVTKIDNVLINSRGVNCKYPTYKAMIEVIPTWKGEKEEVELYLSNETSFIDFDKITKLVNDKLIDAKNRGVAKEIPDIKEINVMLGICETAQICKFFLNQFSYRFQYTKMANFKLNDEFQIGDNDKLTIICKPLLKGSTNSKPVDDYGTKLVEKMIIKDGKGISLYGDIIYGYYLGEKEITGNYTNFEVLPGTLDNNLIKPEKYLECVNFSSFQLDYYSGYYGGEVRLGYICDGGNKIPVSGFCVSGNIYEDIKKIRFSQERDSLNGYFGPKYSYVKMSVNK